MSGYAKIVVFGFLVVCVSVVGCGGEKQEFAEVKGKVQYKGEPLPFGMVVFQSVDGNKRGVGPIGRDGTFTLKSPIGKVKAAVVTRPADPNSVNDPNRAAVRDVVIPKGFNTKNLPPQKYESFNTSSLEYDVKGDQTVNIDLE